MKEQDLKLMSGWPALAGVFAGLGLLVLLVVAATQIGWLAWVIIPGFVVWFISLFGFVVNGPNTARVVQLFGTYAGTVRDVGFFYGNPFYLTTKVSLRVRTFETGVQRSDEVKDAQGKVTAQATQTRRPLKVNDLDGTPIEIAAVVVWKVVSAAEAVFQVLDYEE